MHHSLGQGVFNNFRQMYTKVTCAQAVLNMRDAQRQIDQTLLTCYREKRPVYIEMAADLAKLEIEIDRHAIPDMDYGTGNDEALQMFVTDVQALLDRSKAQMVIAGHEVERFGLKEDLAHFLDKVKIPAMTLNMGKGAIDETSEYYAGLYFGKFSLPQVQKIANESDLALVFGALFADATTDFTHVNSAMQFIEIHPYFCRIGKQIYNNICMADAMQELSKLNYHTDSVVPAYLFHPFQPQDAALTQNRLFEAWESYLQEGNIFIG